MIGNVFRNAGVPAPYAMVLDFTELSQIFGLWGCTLSVVSAEGRDAWICKAGLGLKVLGIEESIREFASPDDALASGVKALDYALRAVIDNQINPWDQKYRAEWLASELKKRIKWPSDHN
jgi:hypothetical protein